MSVEFDTQEITFFFFLTQIGLLLLLLLFVIHLVCSLIFMDVFNILYCLSLLTSRKEQITQIRALMTKILF